MKGKMAAVVMVAVFLLAAGTTYAVTPSSPPSQIEVEGSVYYVDGAPAGNCTPVSIQLYSKSGELVRTEETCTGKGFPPLEQFRHRYKIALAGNVGEDVVVASAIGATNFSVAKNFVFLDLWGSRPGIISNIGEAINRLIRSIIVPSVPTPEAPQNVTPGGPVLPPAVAATQGLQNEATGITFIIIVLIIIAGLAFLLFERREKKGKKNTPAMAAALSLAVLMIAGSLWFLGSAFTGQAAPKGTTITVMGGISPTAKDVYTQFPTTINVNNESLGMVYGFGGENQTNTTWTNFSYISDGTQPVPCGSTCNPSDGNCTLINVSLIHISDGILQDSKLICSGQGYPDDWAANYYRFKSSVSTADGVSPSEYYVNVSGNNFTFYGKNSTVGSSQLVWLDLHLTNGPPGLGPAWSNNESTIAYMYNPTNLSNFSIRWKDTISVSQVKFESNFSNTPRNYTMTQYVTNYYNYTAAISAGLSYWRSYAVDNEGNWNVSDTWYFTVSKADVNPVSLTINNGTAYVNQNVTITYGTTTVTTGSATAGATLWRNGSSVSNPNTDRLGGGLWPYKVNATGNQNYSANATGLTYYITVNNASNPVILMLNGAPSNLSVTYGTTVNASATGPDGVSLYMNDTNITNNNATVLPVGFYVFNVNSTGNANYTENTTGMVLYATVTAAPAPPAPAPAGPGAGAMPPINVTNVTPVAPPAKPVISAIISVRADKFTYLSNETAQVTVTATNNGTAELTNAVITEKLVWPNGVVGLYPNRTVAIAPGKINTNVKNISLAGKADGLYTYEARIIYNGKVLDSGSATFLVLALPTVAGYAVPTAILALLALLLWKRRKPIALRKYVEPMLMATKVEFLLKNRTRHVYKNIVITDRVPAKTDLKNISPAPSLRKTLEGGTIRLEWHFARLMPHEKKYLNYDLGKRRKRLPKALLKHYERDREAEKRLRGGVADRISSWVFEVKLRRKTGRKRR